MACEKGKQLLKARDTAIDATKGIAVVGKIVGPETPEEKVEKAEDSKAAFQVRAPASEYNEHMTGCKECRENPPINNKSPVTL